MEVNRLKPFTQESLRIIKKASEDNKLVIVVGAGVSMLSNFPSWKEVIDRFSGPFSEQKECYSQNEYCEFLKNIIIFEVIKNIMICCEKFLI